MRTNRNDEPQSIALLRKTLRYALQKRHKNDPLFVA
jgi:hypothetical protein